MKPISKIVEQQKIIKKSYINNPKEHPNRQNQYWTVKGINNTEPLEKEWWVYNPGSGVPHSFSEREIKNKFYQYSVNNPATE
jgi:hypothetical protein